MSKFKYSWLTALNRLKRTAKKEGWPLVDYYDCGYRVGWLKAQGPKWSQVVVLDYRKKKVGEEIDELTKKIKPVYKGKKVPVTKRMLNTLVKIKPIKKKGETK